MKQDSETLSLKQTLSILRRRVPLIVLCAVVLAGAAFAFSKHQARQYTATSALLFDNNSLTNAIAGLPASSSGVSVLAQQASDLELVKVGDMAARTAGALGNGLTQQQVSEGVSVSGQGESGVIDVSATSTSPVLAAKIANTYVRVFVEEQKKVRKQFFQSALAVVHKQLADLSPKQRIGSDGLLLQNRAQTLGLLSKLKQGNVEVAQEAVAPSSPSSPKTSRNTALGGVLGLVIGFALAFILDSSDRRLGGPEELKAVYRLPLLGAIPNSRAISRKGAVQRRAEAEAFGLIHAQLRLGRLDGSLHTVMVGSPADGDGKTTVAINLAGAAARSGLRVLLLEADLRRPAVAKQLALPQAPGIVDVLTGVANLHDVTRRVLPGDAHNGELAMGGTLDVLTAGPSLPLNPGQLFESHTMTALLEQASATYDLVLIDTSPLCVPDVYPLLTKVDGVIIVGRIGHSRRDASERLREILAESGARLVGVVANSSKASWQSPYPRDSRAPQISASSNGASSSEQLVPTVRL